MALLTDGSLPVLYDFALNGVGYLVAWEHENPPWHFAYTEEEPDTVIERRDTNGVEELSENKLDYFVWRSQRTWQGGSGQLRFEAPSSSNTQFQESLGVDVSDPGHVTLLHNVVSQSLSGAGLSGNTVYRYLTTSGDNIFATDLTLTGNYRCVKFVPGSAASAFTFSASETSVYGLASDGTNVYIAFGGDGVDRGAASGSSSTHWSDAKISAIAWVKQQLLGVGVQSGSAYSLMAIASGAGSTTLLTLPEGFSVSQGSIGETASFAYFGAYSNDISYVYVWPGTGTPTIACQLPSGEEVTAIHGLLGKYLMVSTFSSSASVSTTRLYLGVPESSTGILSLTKVFEWTGPLINRIVCMEEVGGKLYFGWPKNGVTSGNDGTPGGLGVFDPAYTATWRHLGSIVEANNVIVGDVTTYNNQLVFSDRNNTNGKIYYEVPTQYQSSGYIVGSVFDWNIDATKNILRAELGYKTLPTDTGLSLSYSTNEGTSYTSIVTAAAASQSQATIMGISAKSITYKAILTCSNAQTATPTLKKVGFGAWYGTRARSQHTISVKAYDRMELKNHVDYPNSGPGLAESIFAALRTLQSNQTLVDFQPPGYGEGHTRSMKVNVRSLTTRSFFRPQVGFGKLITMVLVEVT